MQIIKKLFTRFFCWACEDFLKIRSENLKNKFNDLDYYIQNRFLELEKTSWKTKTTKMLNTLRDEHGERFIYIDGAFNDINAVIAQLENEITDLKKEVKKRKNSPQEIIDKIEQHTQNALGSLQNRIGMLREMEKNIVAQTYSFQQVVNRLDKEKTKDDSTRKGNSPEAEG